MATEKTASKSKPLTLDTEHLVQDILSVVERDREREIVSRRYGLFDRKETLEQIGELLGITRERVRQLEKSVVAKLKELTEQGKLTPAKKIEAALTEYLEQNGGAGRVADISAAITTENSRTDQSRVAFLAGLCPGLVIIEDDDHHFLAVGCAKKRDLRTMKEHITNLVTSIKKHGKPLTIGEVAKLVQIAEETEVKALASISKKLATLNEQWGLVKWPVVNPKNIRDKIYVILQQNGNHMHFNDIAAAIKQSDFKRKDVTTQAIHNELIKDKRFVLIGRGLYALTEWGFKKGTVADIITEVLREAGEPLHRDEIVKRVLESRFVKETTILLNLQGKPQFKRVAKATYELSEEQ